LRFASGSRFQFLTPDRQILLLVFTAALLGRLFALQSWWCLDDWGQLARAAGHLDHSDFPVARVLSQQWYWSLMWPVAGLDAMAHALVRMVLHALAAVAVGRIALRVGQSSFGSLVSGLVFAASPVAFTVLFWASGIQELLAGLLALWAVERWLGSGSRALLVAALLGALSMLAKEPGLGLPVFFLGCCALGGNLSRPRLGVIAFLILMAGWEISLVHGHFASGDADPYSIGGLLVVLKNLGQFGYWLGLPLPVFPPQVPWPQAAWGFLFWGLWLCWGVWSWLRGRRVPAAALVGAVLSLGPALPLVQQVKPYMAYTAVGAVALVLGGLLPAGRFGHWRWRPVVAVFAVAFSLFAMSLRLGTSDPVVRAVGLARASHAQIQDGFFNGGFGEAGMVVVFQQPLRAKTVAQADRLGAGAVRPSPRHSALAGELGLRFMLPGVTEARWLNSIVGVPESAAVFCETGKGFEYWGPCREALLYAGMIDVMVGNYGRAADELLAGDIDGFSYDEEIVGLSEGEFLREAGRFLEWLAVDGRGYSEEELGAIEKMLEGCIRAAF